MTRVSDKRKPMYIPKHFQQQKHEALYELIRKHPLTTLVVNTSSGLCANHIPLRLFCNNSTNIVLQVHIAKSNPLWKESSGEALAIFQGADAYISPNWYPTEKEHGKVVPTWNYVAVHASGQIQFVHKRCWKMNFLHSLTTEHESNQEKPWAVSEAPKEFTEKMLSAIVGFEIAVHELNGQWKISQNQMEKNQTGVIDDLSASSDSSAKAVARVMAERVPVDR